MKRIVLCSDGTGNQGGKGRGTNVFKVYLGIPRTDAEGVRQIRGNSVNPVPDVEHVLVTAGTGVPTSGLILGAA